LVSTTFFWYTMISLISISAFLVLFTEFASAWGTFCSYASPGADYCVKQCACHANFQNKLVCTAGGICLSPQNAECLAGCTLVDVGLKKKHFSLAMTLPDMVFYNRIKRMSTVITPWRFNKTRAWHKPGVMA
jgi:hypothetical protein